MTTSDLSVSVLAPEASFPWVVEPDRAAAASGSKEQLLTWISENQPLLQEKLLQHGAVLFRGFQLSSPEDFALCALTLGGPLKSYVAGNSPRKKVASRVYTSTEYPSDQAISLHNEMSYAHVWPTKLFFFCHTPPAEGGETPLVDSRRLLAALDPAIRQRFEARRIRYVQNLHGGRGMGKSWQETFESEDKAAVEAFLRGGGVEFRWTPGDGLTTSQARDAVAQHPQTGEAVWFNQADQWHASNLGEPLRRTLCELYKEEELPHYASHADGGSIATSDLDHVRAVTRQHEVAFPWNPGDLLMVDNMLMAHGRRPFKGPRKILVAMS